MASVHLWGGKRRRNRSRSPAVVGGRNWVIPVSLLGALFLTVIPYPDWMRHARPDWLTLALFYWCLALPRRVGVGYGWGMGLLLDLLQYTLFGQHALGKALIALVAVGAHNRLRMYPIWQQAMVVFVVSALDVAVVVWIHHVTADAPVRLEYWQTALTTALLWPVAYTTLRALRLRSGLVRE